MNVRRFCFSSPAPAKFVEKFFEKPLDMANVLYTIGYSQAKQSGDEQMTYEQTFSKLFVAQLALASFVEAWFSDGDEPARSHIARPSTARRGA